MQALITELMQMAVENDYSDIHLMANSAPIFRKLGQPVLYTQAGVLSADAVMNQVVSVMSGEQKEKFLTDLEIDFSVSLPGKGRFRANAYFQKETAAISMRLIPRDIKSVDELGLPPILHNIAKLKQGFVLVTGPTGSGKSTTLTAVINEINETRSEHIVTIEDPIEYIHENNKSFISQRELGSDTKSWRRALKSVLRQDPNIVYFGELRDLATISTAMTTAETGHLVFATLHTNSAAQSIERIVDSFPENQQGQVINQLSMVLEAIISQRLVPTIDGRRIVLEEIMVATPAVRNIIRENRSFQIDNVIQTSGNLGMKLLEQSLAEMVIKGVIERQVAFEYAIRPSVLEKLIGGYK